MSIAIGIAGGRIIQRRLLWLSLAGSCYCSCGGGGEWRAEPVEELWRRGDDCSPHFILRSSIEDESQATLVSGEDRILSISNLFKQSFILIQFAIPFVGTGSLSHLPCSRFYRLLCDAPESFKLVIKFFRLVDYEKVTGHFLLVAV